MVLNPTKYTVEGEGDDECRSINEDKVPSKEELDAEHVFPQLSLAYKEQEDSGEE